MQERARAALDLVHLPLLELHQARVRQVERNREARNAVGREPLGRQPHVRSKHQTACSQLVVEQLGARLELGAGDRQLQIAQPHLQQLVVRQLLPGTGASGVSNGAPALGVLRAGRRTVELALSHNRTALQASSSPTVCPQRLDLPGQVGYTPAPLLTLRAFIPSLLRLAWPVVLARLGIMGMGVVDVMVVGQFVPLFRLPFQALGWAPIGVLLVTGIGLLTGVQVLAARAVGAGSPEQAGAAWRRGLVVAALAGAAAVAAVWLLGERLFTAFRYCSRSWRDLRRRWRASWRSRCLCTSSTWRRRSFSNPFSGRWRRRS